jgi:hypothetical protein
MQLPVSGQAASVCKLFVAGFTWKRLLPRVRRLVRDHVASPCKAFAARLARERRLSIVSFFVTVEVASGSKYFVAWLTYERLLPRVRVRPLVRDHVASLCKAFAARLARERLLSIVSLLVKVEVASGRKYFVAWLTYELFQSRVR